MTALQGRVIKHEGRHYLVVGRRAIAVEQVDGEWKPVGAWTESRPNAQGGTDCIVHVPCLEIAGNLPAVEESQ